METLEKSNWLGRIGMSVINAFLLAGLPLAALAVLVEAL